MVSARPDATGTVAVGARRAPPRLSLRRSSATSSHKAQTALEQGISLFWCIGRVRSREKPLQHCLAVPPVAKRLSTAVAALGSVLPRWRPPSSLPSTILRRLPPACSPPEYRRRGGRSSITLRSRRSLDPSQCSCQPHAHRAAQVLTVARAHARLHAYLRTPLHTAPDDRAHVPAAAGRHPVARLRVTGSVLRNFVPLADPRCAPSLWIAFRFVTAARRRSRPLGTTLRHAGAATAAIAAALKVRNRGRLALPTKPLARVTSAPGLSAGARGRPLGASRDALRQAAARAVALGFSFGQSQVPTQIGPVESHPRQLNPWWTAELGLGRGVSAATGPSQPARTRLMGSRPGRLPAGTPDAPRSATARRTAAFACAFRTPSGLFVARARRQSCGSFTRLRRRSHSRAAARSTG